MMQILLNWIQEPTDSQCSYVEHGTCFEETRAVVCYDYQSKGSHELSLQVGDVIGNVVKHDDGWWQGDLNGHKGYFPSNFVEELSDESSVSKVNLDRCKLYNFIL